MVDFRDNERFYLNELIKIIRKISFTLFVQDRFILHFIIAVLSTHSNLFL